MTARRRTLIFLLASQVWLPGALAQLAPNPEAGAVRAIHVVKPGESLGQVAQQYQITVRQLRYANFILDETPVEAGAELAIPQNSLRVPASWQRDYAAGRLPGAPYRLHTVRRGETVVTIARSYGFRAEQLLAVNDLADPDLLEVGQKLRIPHGGLDDSGPAPVPRSPASPAPPAAPPAQAVPPAEAPPKTGTAQKAGTAAPPAVPEQPQEQVHVVGQGETLAQIATRYHITTRQLRFYNLLPDDQEIGLGDRLRIPQPDLRVPWQWQQDLVAGRLPAKGERVHTVARGETLAVIARRYGLSAERLQSYNGIRNPDRLKVGERLRIPAGAEPPAAAPPPKLPGKTTSQTPSGVYVVQAGDSLSLIAKRYGIKVEQLQYLNRIEDPNLIEVGDRLLIPDGALKVPPAVASKYTFMWPLDEFRVVSEFGVRGKRQHRGIDMAAPQGTPIRAAADGVVIYAGTQRGHGRLVVLQHDERTVTLYSHNEDNLVRKGQKVVQGQVIATVGHSGNAQGYHVHFEFIRDDTNFDPRGYVETQLRR